MNQSSPRGFPGDGRLAARLRRELEGEVLFDAFSRGRYSTDASHYQIEPIGVVLPKNAADMARAVEVARDEGVPILPRGGGTSQCGQTVGAALVIDSSKHMADLLELDSEGREALVQPGLVLDRLNAKLRPHGLWFPVDVSTGSRATIGGMAGNNSCGARSIHYGTMRDNVVAIDGLLASGATASFGALPADGIPGDMPAGLRGLTAALLALGRAEAGEIAARFPKLMRRVGGYNIDTLAGNAPPNLAHLLVGSEGTLALSQAIRLKLSPLPAQRVLGVCHFPTFREAMVATRQLVTLNPTAVELVDRTMIELSREIEIFRPVVEEFVRGEPEALLLVEFAGEDEATQRRALADLVTMMGDLGYPNGVVEAIDPAFQKAVWEVRKSGLNIMMSMKGDGKPISFIEDCAVALEDLPDYTDRLTALFERHGTSGTWYAHASVGCLHVRPILNLKQAEGASTMRAIAEEAFAIVREYKGSHSGEHGDGLVRSEFHEAMFGTRMVRAFEQVKDLFDPKGLLNPGKIVRPAKMDDRALFRYKPGYRTEPVETALDWSDWGGLSGAVEMCNNNGACRKRDPGVMCPSFRATGDEQHVTRGRANALRLALSGQLGPVALTSEAMRDSLALCVGCKACKRECPTGVDMARMKLEVAHLRGQKHGWSLGEKAVAYLPRYAAWAARLAPLFNLRDRLPGAARLSESLLGLSARRPLPRWRRDRFTGDGASLGPAGGPEVVLLPDCFNRAFEPENLDAAVTVLTAAGCRVHLAPAPEGRPLCCGRTFLSVGLVEEGRKEAKRSIEALAPYLDRGLPVIGLEPSCLLTFRDEAPALLGDSASREMAARSVLFGEYLEGELAADRLDLPLAPPPRREVLLHGHCHQKAMRGQGGGLAGTTALLGRITADGAREIPSGCCGMAGAFGYGAATYDVSVRMAELDLLPAVRGAGPAALLVADGTSCRHQIRDLTGRDALHSARALELALER